MENGLTQNFNNSPTHIALQKKLLAENYYRFRPKKF